ncbi:MAG: hypothetical protein K9J16_14675 [Melioribacteraceae bacterium]|nr:hypothetical protein [Melioribacteraceae bacterium]MCF8355832.1 hypothetical protein [Melioribacteraceae bacterium]MCF8395275.1 hypothetical protein [Melioribacteraceae bacterium]
MVFNKWKYQLKSVKMKIRLILLIALTLLFYQRSISAQIHNHHIDVKKNTISDSEFNNVQKNEYHKYE